MTMRSNQSSLRAHGAPPRRAWGLGPRRPGRYFPFGHFPCSVQLRCAPPLQVFFWSSFHPAKPAVMVKAAYNVTNAKAMTRFTSPLPYCHSFSSLNASGWDVNGGWCKAHSGTRRNAELAADQLARPRYAVIANSGQPTREELG